MVTIDTNIAIYALEPGAKTEVADATLRRADLVSQQLAGEFANVMRRKFKRPCLEIAEDVELLRDIIPAWHSVELVDTLKALQLVDRYKLQFYDALMIAVGLAHGATTLFSEDMQHGLLIEDTLRIENPFR